ncbi:slit homolog 2 protein [Engraulis encrasicolus]|uniref:slit homolog 2 protein n=1 Tax=Engraulis encrasicolus TaxID=184585 RepID=UPI002FD5AAE8
MLLLLALLTIGLSTALSSRLCSYTCQCYEHSDLVDCRARKLTGVPHGLPHGTWLLDLGGNVLTELRSRAFTGLWSMRILVLSESHIQDIHTQAFHSLSFLEKLDLSHNHLSQLPSDFSLSLASLRDLRLDHNALQQVEPPCLEHLESLEKLDLSHNQLQALRPGAFRGLSRLRHLYLNYNRLAAIREGTFSMLPVLELLLLSHNNISRLDTEAFKSLNGLALLALEGNQLQHIKFKTFLNLQTSATHLQLSDNPWSCDCDLHRVFSKILSVRHLHVDDYRNVTCREPWQLAGASLAGVDSQLCMAETATVLIITGAVLLTVIGALVTAERKRKLNKAKGWGRGEPDAPDMNDK